MGGVWLSTRAESWRPPTGESERLCTRRQRQNCTPSCRRDGATCLPCPAPLLRPAPPAPRGPPTRQPPEASRRGALQLLDALDAASPAASDGFGGLGGSASGSAGQPPGGAARMPPGFLEDFAARFADEGLENIVAPIGEQSIGSYGS